MVLAGCLYAHDVPHAFHYANDAVVTLSVRAYGADIVVRYHLAVPTVFYVVAEVIDGIRKMVDIGLWLREKVQRKPERTAAAYTGQ
jgi:hypothetical protein